MKRIPVKSSNLKSVGYDEKTTLLEVEFLDDSIYQYSRVPKAVYLELMNAQSKGSYFSKNISSNRSYSCRMIYPDYKERRG